MTYFAMQTCLLLHLLLPCLLPYRKLRHCRLADTQC